MNLVDVKTASTHAKARKRRRRTSVSDGKENLFKETTPERNQQQNERKDMNGA